MNIGDMDIIQLESLAYRILIQQESLRNDLAKIQGRIKWLTENTGKPKEESVDE